MNRAYPSSRGVLRL